MTITKLIDILQSHKNKLGDCEIEGCKWMEIGDKGQLIIHEKE